MNAYVRVRMRVNTSEYPQLRALQNLIKLLNLLTATDEGNLSRRNR